MLHLFFYPNNKSLRYPPSIVNWAGMLATFCPVHNLRGWREVKFHFWINFTIHFTFRHHIYKSLTSIFCLMVSVYYHYTISSFLYQHINFVFIPIMLHSRVQNRRPHPPPPKQTICCWKYTLRHSYHSYCNTVLLIFDQKWT